MATAIRLSFLQTCLNTSILDQWLHHWPDNFTSLTTPLAWGRLKTRFKRGRGRKRSILISVLSVQLDHSKACTLQHQQEETRLRKLLSNKEAEINESVVARKNLQSKSKNLESTLKTCQSSLDFWEKKCEKVDLDYGQLQNSSNKR